MSVSLGKYQPYAKAVAAFIALLVPFLVAVGAALTDGVITGEEVATMSAAGTALLAGVKAVYQVENRPADN